MPADVANSGTGIGAAAHAAYDCYARRAVETRSSLMNKPGVARLPFRFGRLPWRDPNTRFLALAVLVGLLGAAAASVFRFATSRITLFVTGHADIVSAAASLPPVWRVALPAAGGLIGGFIARRFVRTGGTMGIAQIMEVVAVGRRTVRFGQSAARAGASLAVIATGGSEGREGPIIQMAAAIAAQVGKRMGVSKERAQILVACGMAAGVAGAYNTPIAATLFVIELIVGSFSMAVFGPVVISSVVSAVATRAVLGDAPLYHVAPFQLGSAWELVPYVPLGLLAGVASVAFTRTLRLSKHLFRATGLPDELRMTLAGAGVGALGLFVPEVWGNGFEGTNRVLSSHLGLSVLCMLCLAKLVATALTIGSGGVGGVFTPGLMIGATVGGALGTLVERAFPQLSAPVYCYALLGMGGLLAGTTRAPILSIIMLFELTNTPAIVLPMMIVAVLAIVGARVFERESIYVEELRDAGVQWQGTLESTSVASLRARDVLRGEVPLIPPTLALDSIVERFMHARSLYLYVGTADGKLLGVVDLHDVKEYLADPALGALVIASDIAQDIPWILPDDTLASVNEKLWFRDYGQLPVVDSPENRRFLGIVTRKDLLGAIDHEILQRRALVTRVQKSSDAWGYVGLPKHHRLVDIAVPEGIVGRRLVDVSLRERGVVVLAVRRVDPKGAELCFVPAPGTEFERGDRLVALATDESLRALAGEQPGPESVRRL